MELKGFTPNPRLSHRSPSTDIREVKQGGDEDKKNKEDLVINDHPKTHPKTLPTRCTYPIFKTGPREACEQCETTFRSSMELKQHLADQHQPRLPCKYCHKSLKTEKTLKEHIRRLHKDQESHPMNKDPLRKTQMRSIKTYLKTPAKHLKRHQKIQYHEKPEEDSRIKIHEDVVPFAVNVEKTDTPLDTRDNNQIIKTVIEDKQNPLKTIPTAITEQVPKALNNARN